MGQIENLQTERSAGEALRQALGGDSFTHTGGNSAAADGFLVLSDGSEICIEVTRTVVGSLRSAMATAEKLGNRITLDRGSGTWLAMVPSSTKLDEFVKMPPDSLIGFRGEPTVVQGDLPTYLDARVAGFRVTALQRLDESGGVLWFFPNAMVDSKSVFISTHPNAVAEYLQDEISAIKAVALKRGGPDKFEKLVQRAAECNRSAEFVFVVKETLDTSLQFSMIDNGADHGTTCPTMPLELPDGIDRMWVARSDFLRLFSYSKAEGWKRYDLRSD